MKKGIDGKTRVIGVMGGEIENSLSPFIQNQLILKYSLNFCYLPFPVNKEDLGKAIQGIKALNIKGVNVTFPFKEKVRELLDQIEDSAQKIGAVNTVVNVEGKLIGYNTDVVGFSRGLQEVGKFRVKRKKAVVLGAGGAARGVIFALLEEGIEEISIFNRTLEKAKKIKEDFSSFFPGSKIYALPPKEENLKDKIGQAALLVNATSLGMPPQVENTPLPQEGLFHSRLLVYDLVYHPRKTLFLKQAEKAGARTINGLPMLVYQGAESFYLWTGCKPEEEELWKIISQLH